MRTDTRCARPSFVPLFLCCAANSTSLGAGSQGPTLSSLSASASNATALSSTAFQLGRQLALTCILDANNVSNVGLIANGWTFHNNSGVYGSKYLLWVRKFSLMLLLVSHLSCWYHHANSGCCVLCSSVQAIAHPFTSRFLINNTINRYTIGDGVSIPPRRGFIHANSTDRLD